MTTRVAVLAPMLLVLSSAPSAQTGAVRIGGAVPHPVSLTSAEIAGMPHQSVTVQVRGQAERYTGIPLIELLKRAGAPAGEAIRGPELTKVVVVSGADGYRVAFALAELDPGFTDRIVLLADRRNTGALPANALPYQLIVPWEQRPTRWVRQVVSIDVIEVAPAR